MALQVIFKGIKISLQHNLPVDGQLEIKFCFNHQIHKFKGIFWNQTSLRWQLNENVYLKLLTPQKIQVELLSQSKKEKHKNIKFNVIAQALLDLQQIKLFSKKQYKIILTYDFQVVGAMYFQAQIGEDFVDKPVNTSLYFQKAQILWSQVKPKKYNFIIKREDDQIFSNSPVSGSKLVSFIINKFQKTVFSTIYYFVIEYQDNSEICVPFYIDKIQRGIRTQISIWITVKNKKVGQLKIIYFLQNSFLENTKGLDSILKNSSNRSIMKRGHNYVISPEKHLRLNRQMSIQKKQLNVTINQKNKQNNIKRYSQVAFQVSQLIKSQGRVKFNKIS